MRYNFLLEQEDEIKKKQFLNIMFLPSRHTFIAINWQFQSILLYAFGKIVHLICLLFLKMIYDVLLF